VPPRKPAEPGVPAGWDQVLAWRLDRQHLTEPTPVPPAAAGDGLVALVRRLSGVHAQLASAAEAAVWLRTAGAVGPADVRAALTEHRTLVKTWTVRGTLHLLPAADLPRWTAALGTRTFPRPESWYRYHGVTPEEMDAIQETVPQVLSGTPVTREQLATRVAERSGRPEVAERLLSGWGALLKPLAARGELAFGPADGRTVTFVAPRQWLGPRMEQSAPDAEQAVAGMVRDFLDTYGPASLDELVRWSALDRPVLRRAVRALAGELVELDTEGHRGWVSRAAAERIVATGPSRVVRLLAGFDPYVVGALTQLKHLLSAGERAAVSRTSGWISPVLVDGGRIVGTWTQQVRAGRLQVAVMPFGRLRAGVRKATAVEAERWAGYAAVPLALSWERGSTARGASGAR
jgi:uncharacterized protein YcaQ